VVSEGLKGLVIDDMRESDIPEVAEIERSSFTTPWSEQLFFNELKNPRSVPKVARSGGRVAGYICASRIIDEGHILNLAVHQSFRGLGIAKALVGEMISYLKEEGCRFIFLEVRDSNETAKKLYGKFGFRMIGTRKNYYVSPVEDAVIMVWKSSELENDH
jgi:ribosomal-protein-alanine N-acetyltransferase